VQNRNSDTEDGRVVIPGSSTNDTEYDIITSPLPRFIIRELRDTTHVGPLIENHLNLDDVVMLAACTDRADRLLSDSIVDLVVIGEGEGSWENGKVKWLGGK
jgi:hypothetical protein